MVEVYPRFMNHKVWMLSLVITTAQNPIAIETPSLDRPLILDSSTRGSGGTNIPGPKFRVVPMRGLTYPYALAFLPDGSMLITERAGRLRIVRDGKLDPRPIA